MEQQQDIIISPIQMTPRPNERPKLKKKHEIRLFSMIIFITVVISLYKWASRYQVQMANKSFLDLKGYEVIDLLQYDTHNNFQDAILKQKIYWVPLNFYIEPNILICICIVLTFPMVINFIERQGSTSIAFFQYHLNAIYLQILNFGLDFIQYFLVSKCICLQTGAGAIWINLFTKIIYYNTQDIQKSKMKMCIIIFSYSVAIYVIIVKNRLDLLISIIISLIDIIFLQGGSIKYPKSVLQQKEEWAQAIKIDKFEIWQKFFWNEYVSNSTLCIDSKQYYVTRQKRQVMNNA